MACVSRYMEYLNPFLKAVLVPSGEAIDHNYKSAKDLTVAFEGVEDLLIAVVEIPVQSPQNDTKQEAVYAGEKKFHRLKGLLISDKNQGIQLLSTVFRGKQQDFGICKELFPKGGFKDSF